jgi:hypothetical protein
MDEQWIIPEQLFMEGSRFLEEILIIPLKDHIGAQAIVDKLY